MVSDDDRAVIEQAIEDARLRPYQAMVVRTIAQAESATAALNWVEQVKELEVRDGTAG